jgi:hypothetical protein
MKPTARWSIAVSAETDRRVRRFLETLGRKGDLSKFVEDAVKARLLELRMQSLPLQSRPSANDVQPAPPQDVDEDGERQYGR